MTTDTFQCVFDHWDIRSSRMNMIFGEFDLGIKHGIYIMITPWSPEGVLL